MNKPQYLPTYSGQLSNFRVLALVTSLFFIWSFITCLNDILIPYLKAAATYNLSNQMIYNIFIYKLKIFIVGTVKST